jgi:hypothetical protein
VRFARKRAGGSDEATDDTQAGIEGLPAIGPFDESQVDLEGHEGIDLGSLVVTPGPDMEVQLQVDETSGEVGAVLLVGHDGALELRAFAASRGGGAWDELRPQIAAEVTRLGGTATQRDGAFGRELMCRVPMQTPDGQSGTQTSRVTGHEGGAWLLRATLVGPPAAEEGLVTPWEEAIRKVVVRRGREARPPGSPLPLRLPPEARQLDTGD